MKKIRLLLANKELVSDSLLHAYIERPINVVVCGWKTFAFSMYPWIRDGNFSQTRIEPPRPLKVAGRVWGKNFAPIIGAGW